VVKFPRRQDRSWSRLVARGIIALAALGAAACGRGKPDLCAGATHHLFELAGAGTKAGEKQVIDANASATVAKCQQEGLSQPQADCILAAHGPEWADQLRACPAFAAKPASWVTLGPSRDDRRKLRGKPPVPDGPRHGPGAYIDIIASRGTTCGLTQPGKLQCWGEKREVPDGTFIHLRADGQRVCGLDPSGIVACTSRDPHAMRTPPDPLSDFDIASGLGCGVTRNGNKLVCWNDLDGPGLQPPDGLFAQVALHDRFACALDVDQHVTCFGDGAPAVPSDLRATAVAAGNGHACSVARDGKVSCWGKGAVDPPSDRFISISCAGAQCCGITAKRDLACWGPPDQLREPPAGTFDSVAVFDDHSCAVRTGGGTECWGNNDDGQCNVPQDAASHWY
jgi:hypothetical protein